ncbi:MAG TPA: hypothetical protein VF322_01375 [Gammaproteobacteria bacterium]
MWGLAALVVLHLVVPVVMALRSADLAASINAANPELSPENLRIASWVATGAAAAFHLVFVGVYAWLGLKVWAGRR